VSPGPILLVAADNGWRQQLVARLARERLPTVESATAADLVRTADGRAPGVVIVAVDRHDAAEALSSIARLRAGDRKTPVILVAGAGSEALAVAALRAGVSDYRLRTEPLDDIVASVRRACPTSIGAGPPVRVGATSASDPEPEPLLGDSPCMREIKAYVAKVVAADSAVLITGETGTGKELVARLIHHGSPRGRRPFVSINCAAIPDGLLESELFGHEAGAFTGAQATREGHLQAARGGTVFFDEIGDMGLLAQAKVLRVIEGKPLYRVGGRRSIALDFRVVAATNQDLEQAMAGGRFRMDLYFRVNVARIHLPPLRERTEDIPALVGNLIGRLNWQFGRRVRCVTEPALRRLMQHDWPGNVRELRNVLEASFINLPQAEVDEIDLPADVAARIGGRDRRGRDDREHLLSVLAATKWNKSKAAQELRWSRMTLYRKLAKYHLTTNVTREPVSPRLHEEKRLRYASGEVKTG